MASKPSLLRPGGEGEPDCVSDPDVQLKWEAEGSDWGRFVYERLPFTRWIPKGEPKGPTLSSVADAVCDFQGVPSCGS